MLGFRRFDRALAALGMGFTVMVSGVPGARATTASPTVTGTPAHTPAPSTILGRVATNGSVDGCTGGRAGVTVRLEPGGRAAVTSDSGEFVFEDVSFGYYTLHVEPDCEPIPCYGPYSFVVSNDAAITLCYEDCPATLIVEPSAGAAGTVVDVSGYCYVGVAGENVAIYFDEGLGAETTADSDGLYGTSIIVPANAGLNESHRVRAVVQGDEISVGYFSVQPGPEPCVGDCDGDFAVTIDELVRGVRAALGSPLDCSATDSTEDGTVSVAELIAAVGRALNGCHAADLVPTGAHPTRCRDSCAAATEPRLFMDVCVANRGDVDAPRFSVLLEGPPGGGAPIYGLAAGDETCVELAFAGDVTVTVDYYDVVTERNETNNQLPVAIGTACDVVGPQCTPTPSPMPTPT